MTAKGKSQRVRRGTSMRPAAAKQGTPVWDQILKIVQAIPASDLHKLPTDLAANHDHYLYGASVR